MHSSYPVEQDDTDVLDDAVESHELKNAERCNESSSAFPLERKERKHLIIQTVLLVIFWAKDLSVPQVQEFVQTLKKNPDTKAKPWLQNLCNNFSPNVSGFVVFGTETCLHLMRLGTQEMLEVDEVNGEATDASSSDREIPLWALFRAWVAETKTEDRSLGLMLQVFYGWCANLRF